VNLYCIEYWSLSHFLFHHEGGKYAGAYRKLIAGEGTLANFESSIGPIAKVQRAWYEYLQIKISETFGNSRR